MSSPHDHPDFANVVRVLRFHQAPQRVQQFDPHQVVPPNLIVPAFGADFRRMFRMARSVDRIPPAEPFNRDAKQPEQPEIVR